MIHFCTEIWGGKEIRSHLIWPMFGTYEEWTCRALNNYVNNKNPRDQEEKEYAKIWEGSATGLFTVKTRKVTRSKSEAWDPLDNLPPPYLMPLPEPPQAQAPPPALPMPPPPLEQALPTQAPPQTAGAAGTAASAEVMHSPPARRT